MRIAFVTLGCKLNYAETSTYERHLLEKGCEAVSWTSGKAEAFLVNTCSVTERSDSKCRSAIRKLHRLCPDAPIFVTGCYAQLKRAEIEALDGVAAVFGANQKGLVVDTIWQHFNSEGAEVKASACQGAAGEFFQAHSSGERTRSFLKVQDGCNNFCSYCTVPYARGESRNAPIAQIVRQAEEIAAMGYTEIVLSGVNTGDFGKSTGETFFELIQQLQKVEGIERYRISSIEPNLLTEEMVDWIATEGTKFLPHFHIPLQSGSDEILSQMGRKYDTEYFARKIDYIRSRMEGPGKPKVFFGIDVIVGFPGESDELFQQTYRFLDERIKPAFIHVFPYSRRPGTPAAARKDQVQDGVKTDRVAALESLCARLHDDFEQSNKGIKCKVLFESACKKGMMMGYTENYIQVSRKYDESLVGKITEMTI